MRNYCDYRMPTGKRILSDIAWYFRQGLKMLPDIEACIAFGVLFMAIPIISAFLSAF